MNEIKYRRIITLVFLFEIVLFFANIPGLRIHIDEAWLGEQSFYLAQDGVVRSEMFGDFMRYDEQILVYHKGFIIAGAYFLKIFGFGLFSLRLVSLISTAILFTLLYYYCRKYNNRTTFFLTSSVLFLCPLIFRNSILYRPEAMLALFGFISFLFLLEYLDNNDLKWLLASGAVAGLAVFCHLNGLVFIGAGIILLLYRRKWQGVIVFGIIAVSVSTLYFYDVIGHWDLFKFQFLNGPHNAAENAIWYKPFLNLANEHKRIFRKPEIIGITSLFILSAIYFIKERRRDHYNIIIYAIAAVVVMGIFNHNKTTKYAILYFPYFALVVANNIEYLVQNPSFIRKPLQIVFIIMLMATVILGLEFSGRSILSGKENLEGSNGDICSHIPRDAKVLAPVSLMFNEIDNYDIIGLQAARLMLEYKGMDFNCVNLCQLAKELKIEYIIIDDEYRRLLGCSTGNYSCLRCKSYDGLITINHSQIYKMDSNGREWMDTYDTSW